MRHHLQTRDDCGLQDAQLRWHSDFVQNAVDPIPNAQIFFESLDTTGTRKKFPIAPRKRCSSTLPESSTWLTHEPPLRFVVNCAASSVEGTPLSSSKLIND